ncbi:hypothetical protein NMG60_11030698 [Bertholletia excelsa]
MAEECTESSIATSSVTPNWWLDLHASSLSSRSSHHSNNPWHHHPHNPNSNNSSGGEDDVSMSTTSFTNASAHSGLSVESSRCLLEPASTNELIGETASDNHLWSQVLLSAGNSGELNTTQDVGENSINLFLPKNLSSTTMFEPAFDYLKKTDNRWEFSNPPSLLNNFEKHVNGIADSLIDGRRLNKLSNLLSNWSIAPPQPEISHQYDLRACDISLSPSCGREMSGKLGSFSNFHGHEMKVKGENTEVGALFGQQFNTNRVDQYPIGVNSSLVGENNKFYYGIQDVTCNAAPRNLVDVMGFNSLATKVPCDIHGSKSALRSLNLSDCKKQGIQASSQPTMTTWNTAARSNARGQGINSEGKKKRGEDNSETVLKKPKHENSTVSSAKMQVPKVKLGDKIAALQQIVSPFGKTDTASVLWETIGYIKFLQEQVQVSLNELFSNPYMKTNASKDPWTSLDRKDRGEIQLDLRSRGLCLVPISCTPQVYRENTGSDYWTPAYRSCLYR